MWSKVGRRSPAAALNEDGSPNGPGHPAQPGSNLTLYGTRFGATSSQALATPLGVHINSQPTPLLFAGQAPGGPPGLIEIEVAATDLRGPQRYRVNIALGFDFQLGDVSVWVGQ